MDITFCGAAGTVTGSRYLVQTGKTTLLVDCGLFQGFKELRLRNWEKPPFDPRRIDAVLLTHAHVDHSGYIPVLVKNGFRGKVHCTRPTRDLCQLLLPDSGHLLEEEAHHANRHGYSKHHPALALYTEEDARAALVQFRGADAFAPVHLAHGITCTFLPAGHILGAAMVLLDDGETRVLFTGDLGRPHDPVMIPPTTISQELDALVVESTYGNRKHVNGDAVTQLGDIIRRTAARRGTVVVPSFCVGRAQEVLFHILQLKELGEIPDVPVYLNSPMAQDATRIYCQHPSYHRMTSEQCEALCKLAKPVTSVEDSKQLNVDDKTKIIIAGSGMATGGRVVHHIKRYAPDQRNTILFVGYQAAGTRGAKMMGGAPTVRIHGQDVPVAADVINLEFLSAHSDYVETMAWLRAMPHAPRSTLVTHGEPAAAAALEQRIQKELGWNTVVPSHLQSVTVATVGNTIPNQTPVQEPFPTVSTR